MKPNHLPRARHGQSWRINEFISTSVIAQLVWALKERQRGRQRVQLLDLLGIGTDK